VRGNQRNVHGLVILIKWLYHLFQSGTGAFLGKYPVPGTGTGLQRGHMTFIWNRGLGQVSFGLFLFQCNRFSTGSMPGMWYKMLEPLTVTVPVPHGTGTVTVTLLATHGTGTLRAFRSRHLAWFRGFS